MVHPLIESERTGQPEVMKTIVTIKASPVHPMAPVQSDEMLKKNGLVDQARMSTVTDRRKERGRTTRSRRKIQAKTGKSLKAKAWVGLLERNEKRERPRVASRRCAFSCHDFSFAAGIPLFGCVSCLRVVRCPELSLVQNKKTNDYILHHTSPGDYI